MPRHGEIVVHIVQVAMIDYAVYAPAAADTVGEDGIVESKTARCDLHVGIVEMVGHAVDGQPGSCVGTLAAFEINLLKSTENSARTT